MITKKVQVIMVITLSQGWFIMHMINLWSVLWLYVSKFLFLYVSVIVFDYVDKIELCDGLNHFSI